MKIYFQTQPVPKNISGWKRAMRLLDAWSSGTLVIKTGGPHASKAQRSINQ
jgi:hypothetical protein